MFNFPAAQALLPVQIDGENEGLLVVKGKDLLQFLVSMKKTGQPLDAHSLQRCFVKSGAAW